MTAPISGIEGKVELAAVYHLNGISALVSGITIHPGIDSGSLAVDHIVANVRGCDEAFYQSGLYKADLEIEIVTQADDSNGNTHRSRVGYVRDEFANNWVGVSMGNHVSDLLVHGVELQRSQQSHEDRHWTTTLNMTVHCQPTDG